MCFLIVQTKIDRVLYNENVWNLDHETGDYFKIAINVVLYQNKENCSLLSQNLLRDGLFWESV